MKAPAAPWRAVTALAGIACIAAGWWLLALWPVESAAAPAWLLRTRQVCFGAMGDTLPSAAGWLVLIGEPIGMVGLLLAIAGTELRQGLRLMANRAAGRLALALALLLVLSGLGAAAVRVRSAGERFDAGWSGAASLTRVNDAAPALSLTDQAGQQVTLDAFRGRPVIVTFAFAHCQTVCPLIVSDVLNARRQTGDARPAILVVTLDPWRDTPDRLPSIADAWKLEGDAHVLSGTPEDVERTLNAWRVPRTRNMKTGDVLHPAIIYIVGPDGRITYALTGGADAIASAVRAL